MTTLQDERVARRNGNDPTRRPGEGGARGAGDSLQAQTQELLAESWGGRPASSQRDPFLGRLARRNPRRVPSGVSVDAEGMMTTEDIEGVAERLLDGGAGLGPRMRRVPASPEAKQSAIESLLNSNSYRQGEMSPEEIMMREIGLNGRGYEPSPDDERLLARIIFAESSNIPEDYEAVGWTTVNRVGDRRFRPTLEGVLRQPRQYAIVEEGGGPKGGIEQWRLSADPEALTGANRASWERAERVAAGIMSGDMRDPTGGATHFFSSEIYDGDPRSAEGGFQRSLRTGRMSPSRYQSRARGPRRNYFFREEERE